MAHVHEFHGTMDGTATGFVTGVTLAVAALLLALVVGGIVLLATQPWNDGNGGNGITNNNTVPGIGQPQDNSGGNGDGDTSQPAQ